MRHTKAIATLILAVTVSACGGGGADSDTFTTRDSAGIRIVENVTPVWDYGGYCQLE